MISDAEIAIIEKTIGYTFKNRELLHRAFMHSSKANEMSTKSNERLEFLGDSIANFVVTKYLFEKFDDKEEGTLTQFRAKIVSAESFSDVINKKGLINYLAIGKGMQVDKTKLSTKIKCDLFEALLGAIYRDGCMADCANYVLKMLGEKLNELNGATDALDQRTLLKEKLDAKGKVMKDVDISVGNIDAKDRFTMGLAVDGEIIGIGCGSTKKKALQEAAKDALLKLDKISI